MSQTTTEKPQAALLQLKFQQKPGGHVDATIPIRWCVSPALIDELKDKGFMDPQLLLVVQHPKQELLSNDYTHDSWHDTSRYLVPIENEMRFVTFKRPGINRVVAVIVDVSRADSKKDFHKRLFAHGTWGYRHGVTDGWSGEFYSNIEGAPVLNDVSSTLEVDVPKEMFAPEPPAWLRTIVTRFFDNKSFDQCHFRRRSIISLVTLPFFIVAGTIFKLLSLVAALVAGVRDPAVKHLFHPFSGAWLGIWEDSNGTSFWFHKRKKEYDYHLRYHDFPRIVMNPFVVFVPPAIVFWIGQANYHSGTGESEVKKQILDWGWWKTFSIVVGTELALVLGIMLVMFAISVISGLGNSPQAKSRQLEKRRLQKEREARRNATRQDIVLRELESMICTANGDVSIEALRKDKQTVALRFAQVKSRVCRPFAT